MRLAVQHLDNSNAFRRHLVGRAYRKTRTRRLLLIGLSLTSMVDMFSLLVIFLLQSFSTTPELLFVAKGVTLPSARTGLELKDAPVLSVATDGIYLDQKFVGKTSDVLRNPDELLKRLEAQRTLWQRSHPKEEFKGEISLQAHREIPSTIVSQLMSMLPSQNFGTIQLAVIGTSGGT